MNALTNIIGHIPQDLRSNEITALGAYRDATRKLASGASFEETKAQLSDVLAQGLSIHNDKAVGRLTTRLKRILGDRLIHQHVVKGSSRKRGYIATFMAVEPEDLKIGDLEIYVNPARGHRWRYELAGRVSRHAAGRYIERSGLTEISLKGIAASAVLTLRFVRQLRRFNDLGARIVPVPDCADDNHGMVAIVDVVDGVVITYVNQNMLRGARAEWVKKFEAYDDLVKEDQVVFETRPEGYVRLLNEGARIWAETRERHEVAA